MDKKKIWFSWLLMLVLLVTAYSSKITTRAATITGTANSDVSLAASRNGDTIKVSLVANTSLDLGGIGFYYRYDDKVSADDNKNSDNYFLNCSGGIELNTTSHLVGIFSNKIFDKGTEIVSMSYNITDGFKPDTNYIFSMEMDEVFERNNGPDYNWNNDTFTVTYREHTVSFDLNGGDSSKIEDQYVVTGEKASKPKDPTRTGYTFAGWKKGDTNFNFDTPITGKTELVAQWAAKSHNITYSVSGDTPEGYTVPESQSVEYGTEVTVGTVPQSQTGTKGGINGTFTFEGWTSPEGITVDNGTFSMPDNDVTFTGVWTFTPDKYTVTFDSDGGTTVNPQKVTSGSKAAKPADPTKDGYTFKEWTLNGQPYDFTSPVAGNITLKASWTANAGYTVDTKKEKHTYEIYQIFTGDYTQVTEGEGDDAVTKDVLTNLVWGQNAPEGKTGPVSDEVVQALNKAAGRELDKDKLTEIEKVVDLNSTPIKKVSADGDDPVSVDLPGGYYLIRDVPDSQSGKNDAYTTYITVVVKDYTITPKSALPTIDKQVADDDNVKDGTSEDKNSTNKNPDTTWGESADHAINESFQFKLIATIPAPASGEYNRFDDYKTYKLIFYDTMSKGVTFDSIASVKVNNADVPDSGYTKSEIVTGDGGAQTWSLTIPDVKKYDDLKDGATVTVVYNAHLNKDAIVHNASADQTETNKNSVYLEYSNNPNTGYEADLGKTESDTVWVFTYKVENIKKADSENGEALPNAGFTLYDSESNAIKLINNNDGTYTVADQTKDSGTITEMKSGTDGKFTVIGLDAGIYTLKETSTPSGYNTCDDTTIKIDATHKETDDTAKAGLILSNDSTMANTIINKSGAILPSTGGIGTTIFYILGCVLVIGAGIILVSRKRMEA